MALDVVILAAGQGTRMKSALPKVLHPLGGQPLVLYSVKAASALTDQPPVLVIGHGAEQVRAAVGEAARYVLQPEQLGTGHAVLQARDLLHGRSSRVIVTYADMPLLRAETLQALAAAQQAHTGPFSLITLTSRDSRGFGRIVRAADGSVQAIVEESAATPEQLAIDELNVGIYCFEGAWLWDHLPRIPLNARGEYFLTDLVEIAVSEGQRINAVPLHDPVEALGINTRVHLAEAEAALRDRVNQGLMLSGVTILDPATTYIHPTVRVGLDTVILPHTCLWGGTVIGESCVIGPGAVIQDSVVGNRCRITASVVESATVEDDVEIGPFGHLRRGAHLEAGVHMGNFGEVKNSRLRRGVKMGHFSYVGDADIGEETNIGAGTITCNYDGARKHRTVTGRGVFIGSDTMLVAPVTLGDGARTGAGSVVTHDVPANTLVVGMPARPRPAQASQGEEK